MNDRTPPPNGESMGERLVSLETSMDLLAYPSDTEQYSEEDLKKLAESLAPRVTSLLNTNEEALENLLSSEQKAWQEEEEKFQLQISPGRQVHLAENYGDEIDDDEDGMDAEWSRLAVAEDSLREELEMSDIRLKCMKDASQDQSESSVYSTLYETSQQEIAAEVTNIQHQGIYTSRSLIDDEEDTLSDDEVAVSFEDDDDPIFPTVDKSRPNETVKSYNDIQNYNGKHPTHHTSSVKDYMNKGGTYTLYDHARVLGLDFNNADLGYPSCPLLSHKDVKEFLDVPNFHSTMFQAGDDAYSMSSDDDTQGVNISDAHPQTLFSSLKKNSKDGIRDEQQIITQVMQCTREYVKPMKGTTLAKIFAGFDDGTHCALNSQGRQMRHKENETDEPHASHNSRPADKHIELLPVRTASIRIRPDILCGAVMDAAYTAVQSIGGEVIKRQGSHLRALVPGCCIGEEYFEQFRPDESFTYYGIGSLFSPTMSPKYKNRKRIALLPPFLIDVQLCIRRRSRDGERSLLIRSFRVEEDQLVDGVVCPPIASSVVHDGVENCGGTLRESAALFQRIRSVANIGGTIALDSLVAPPVDTIGAQDLRKNDSFAQQIGDVIASPMRIFKSESGETNSGLPAGRRLKAKEKVSHPMLRDRNCAEKFASDKLMNSFRETPSILDDQEELEPIPALSIDDWPFVQSTWRFLKECLNELDNRDLAYGTLVSCPFGAFPALPTLDAHYCSQMKVLCRDNMISSLVNSAQELEQFAKEAEYSCAILIQALRPTFKYYKINAPPIPEPLPLTAYPLDFEAPEGSSWGHIVMGALNRVAATSSIHCESLTASSLNTSSESIVLTNKIEKNLDDGETDPKSLYNGGQESKKTEFDRAQEAVSTVLSAFHKQEDEELSARLCRKNVQVMDRLAKMQVSF